MRGAWLLTGLVFFAAVAVAPAPEQSGKAKPEDFEPMVFGVRVGNTGCVILKEQRALKKKWLVTGTIVLAGEYEVAQTFHYEMSRTKFEGRKGADELNQIAQKDKVKFVVIPGRYTADEWNAAWDECAKNLVRQQPIQEASQYDSPYQPRAVEPGGDVTAPVVTYEVSPSYTAKAQKAGIEGIVSLAIKIDDTGSVVDAHVREGLGYGVDEEAVKAIKTWKFKPAQKDGKPVAVKVIVQVTFKLRK